uniref:SCAN box domain-containing protein n=1 Tax=Varanus komodoensis TaxID=61221 RepID=A0A8D2Q576_VARKO
MAVAAEGGDLAAPSLQLEASLEQDEKAEEQDLPAAEAGGSCQAIQAEHGTEFGERAAPKFLSQDLINLDVECQRFRQLRHREDESPREVYSRLQELCHQWLKPDRCTKEQILDLVILEKFLDILPLEMQNWVRQGGPGSCVRAVALAEDFLVKQQKDPGCKKLVQGPFMEAAGCSFEAKKSPSDDDCPGLQFRGFLQGADGGGALPGSAAASEKHSGSPSFSFGEKMAATLPAQVGQRSLGRCSLKNPLYWDGRL